MIFFEVEDIKIIHLQIIDASGGSHGVRDWRRLEAVVASQTQNVFGVEVHATIFEKAAALTRGIIADHPFVDGNKRTGIMLALIFLERNGKKTTVADKELEDFAVKIATDKLDVAIIANWLEDKTKSNASR